ncbi:Y-family DNA polymerase [Sandaracinus amylolyticus]|uniref:DNA polymerase IV-like protein ImuB n=1 Tax=Sandaracinus amylolyticus TaxID=927083 RepID=A0A0F6W637_9BACT|nr:DNA polymerase Y family protein [Sandaracinus amylolyticus]AKF08233.1 DNA polymerase IV-like protein ImuB [Sandaracinus amylolyticus]
MSRIACLDVPALPLQVLRRDRPEWAGMPLAVVGDDRPQAPVLWTSQSAQRLGVRVGMRYASALGISRELRAAPVPEARIAEVRAELVGAMHRYSPRVEPDDERPGVIWIDPEGMVSLFGSLERWAQSIWGELGAHDLFGAVVVGFQRMRAWAIARTVRDARVIADADTEHRLAGRVSIARLDLPPELESALAVLGVATLDDFLALPPGELSVRFGPSASRLHALFSGVMREPMTPVIAAQPIAIEAELDPPDDDASRLLFCVKGALHALHRALEQRSLALAALDLTLTMEGGAAPHREVLRPARASRDATSVLELVRLRLDTISLPERVERIRLEAEPAPLEGTQLVLAAGTRRRDPDAATRGIARLRAAFGDEAVTRARLEDAWLPEHQFRWEPVRTIDVPRRAPDDDPRDPPLVRRLMPSPQPLPSDDAGRPVCVPPITEMSGPYRLQSGWWAHGVVRDYWYAERADGALLWMYRDAALDRWFVQGRID